MSANFHFFVPIHQLWWIDDLSRVYPASPPMSKQKPVMDDNGWMENIIKLWSGLQWVINVTLILHKPFRRHPLSTVLPVQAGWNSAFPLLFMYLTLVPHQDNLEVFSAPHIKVLFLPWQQLLLLYLLWHHAQICIWQWACCHLYFYWSHVYASSLNNSIVAKPQGLFQTHILSEHTCQKSCPGCFQLLCKSFRASVSLLVAFVLSIAPTEIFSLYLLWTQWALDS